MIQLHLTTREDIAPHIALREGETKLGPTVQLCDSLDDMSTIRARYVIFGICEDIGVQANYGNPGAKNAWKCFVSSFVNAQENDYNTGETTILLGHISVSPDVKDLDNLSVTALGDIVQRIDKKVATVVQRIIDAGKIPIIIGGGHNNAYGNIKGTSAGLKKPINVINFDAHTDLRSTDYRHSGNGFSYAYNDPEGPYLNQYCIFGLHKNYTPQYILDILSHPANTEKIIAYLMEDMLLETEQVSAFSKAAKKISTDFFGIELDCDSIANFPSSAQTPSGFSLETIRHFINQLAASSNCAYLHICEAAPTKKNAAQVGKALTYLVTDFMRSHRDHHSVS